MGDFIGHHVDTDGNFLRFAVNFITKPLEMLLRLKCFCINSTIELYYLVDRKG